MNGSALGPDLAAASEYPRLVRLCARLTGDVDVAEDLAQETLYEALRHQHELRDPAKRSAWLSGIARNVCLMWARKRAREAGRVIRLLAEDATAPLDLDEWAADELDLERELERAELATLVDRALGLLAPQTRAVIVQKYVEENSTAETAARLGLSEPAVEKRLQRGIRALRRVLTNELIRDAAAYGLADVEADGWEETRIWCPGCGQRRLLGRRPSTAGNGAY